jgi:Uma2 family endonuclease
MDVEQEEPPTMVSTRLHTIDDLLALGPDAPYELIEGALRNVIPTSAEASIVTSRLTRFIDSLVGDHKLGWSMSAEAGFILHRNPDTVVAPDISFVRKGRIPPGFDFQSFIPVAPDLAVEVVSPSNSAAEIEQKRSLYQAAGVPLIWVVYPQRKIVEIYEEGQEIVSVAAGGHLSGGALLPGLTISLDEIFLYPLGD